MKKHLYFCYRFFAFNKMQITFTNRSVGYSGQIAIYVQQLCILHTQAQAHRFGAFSNEVCFYDVLSMHRTQKQPDGTKRFRRSGKIKWVFKYKT